jgi:hypothetical protein
MSGQSQIVNTYAVPAGTSTWFPAEEAVSGTVSTQSTLVTSIGGNFRTDAISEGDWLVNKDGNDARRILRVDSSTQLEISSAFNGGDLAGATVVVVREKAMRFLRVLFLSTQGNVRSAEQNQTSFVSPGTTSGAPWPALVPWEGPKDEDFLTPQLVTPGLGGASVIMGV